MSRFSEADLPEDVSLSIRHFHPGNSTDAERIRTHAYAENNYNIVHPYITVAVLVRDSKRPTAKIIAEAEALCSPVDQPNRARGREIAKGRVLRSYFKCHGRT